MTRIVCISDTHLAHLPPTRIDVPDGDILVHAGDATFKGTRDEIELFSEWFGRLPHKHKVFVPGNHDCGFDCASYDYPEQMIALLPPCHVLMGRARGTVEIEGLKFWGSPYQPELCNWAFNVPRGPMLRQHWATIPDDTDVLVTHSPPMGTLDRVWRQKYVYDAEKKTQVAKKYREHVGCADMWQAVQRVQPRLHVFGHIHCDAGVKHHTWKAERTPQLTNETIFVNAAICDERYVPSQKAVVIDL